MTTKTKQLEEQLPLEARVIQCIAAFEAPKTTQDAVDQLAAEYTVSNFLRQHADKRYEAAKSAVIAAHGEMVNETRTRASDLMVRSTMQVAGEDWMIVFAANKPALRTDVDELRTELIKQGVKVTVIDKAISKVTKKSTPALIVSASLYSR